VYLKEKKNTRQNYIKLAADIVARNTPEYLKKFHQSQSLQRLQQKVQLKKRSSELICCRWMQ